MRLYEKSIIATLNYHNIFDYPLTQQEIYKFLTKATHLGGQAPPKAKTIREIDKFQFEKIINGLRIKKKIFKKDEFYFLPGRIKTVITRKKREKYGQQKIKIAQKVIKILHLIPWLEMVAITGALAMNNSDEDDDIDFLVISSKNRLWLTRLSMILILEILGRRRRPKEKKVKNKICLNMFLDEMAISLSKKKRNLFIAHEIIQARPIFNKNKTYERFLKANLWVKKYLPNGIKTKNEKPKMKKQQSKFKIKKPFAECLMFNILEKLAYKLQLKYMKPKITSELISLHFAFFHPKDRSKEILKEYRRILA